MVIELDGSQHYTQEGVAYDKIRTEILEMYQLEVIRFSNHEIDSNFSGVCIEIYKKIKERVRCGKADPGAIQAVGRQEMPHF